MCRTGMCRFVAGNWIFLLISAHLFTHAQGGDEPITVTERGVRFSVEPSDAVVPRGGVAMLVCAAQARPAAKLTWRHSAAAPPTREHGISGDDKYRKHLSNGSLMIENMSAALAGQYQCVATVDGVGIVVSRVATVLLAELPEVTGGARSVLGSAGSPTLLPCGVRMPARLALRVLAATGPPAPAVRVYGQAKLYTPPTLTVNVTWLKNGSPVRTEREGGRVALTPSGALELDPLRPHDAGLYACRISLAHAPQIYKTSEATELRVSAEIANVETAPRFIATPQPVTVMEGASVTFDCAAVGNPKPEMIWLNNGVAIDLSDLDSRFYLVGSGSLRVQSARALDAGSYTCRAHNRLDSADHGTQLQVLTAPRVHLPDGPVISARTRGDITLRCEVRGRPTPVVSWLKNGEPLTPNNHDIALVDGTSLRIQGVLAVDAGMFQCAAASLAGLTLASLRLVVLPPDDDINTHKLNTSVTISKKSKPTPKISNAKTSLNSLIPVPNFNTSSKYVKNQRISNNSTQDIFNSLISTEHFGDQMLDPTPEGLDFLGETSSAYTSESEVEYDDMYDYDQTSFHAAEGLDLEQLRNGNATIVSAPKALRAVIVKDRFVTLSWEEPEHKKGEVTGYAVIYKAKGSERERVSRGSAQKHEMNVVSLQPNTTYQFGVLAYTERGVSPLTDMIEVTTPEEELTHGPPLKVKAEATGPHSIKVSWSHPAAMPSVPAPSKYTVFYTEVETGREQLQWVEDVEPSSISVSTTLGGLRAACSFTVRVAAAGGAASTELRVRTPSDSPAAPPANITAVPTGATSILVRWDAPPSRTHRGHLTGYKVRYRALPPNSAPTATRRKADSLTTPADTRRAELRDLETHTTYQIRVCALNANGSGPFSEWVTATTQPQRLSESSVPPAPPPLTTRAGRDWISVSWSDDGGDTSGGVLVRGYWLSWGLGVPDDYSRELPAHLHYHVIRGLKSNNSEYVISLRASNTLGLGPPVYATVRTKAAAAEGDDLDEEEFEPDDDEEIDDEDEPPPLIPPVGLKVIMLSGSTAVVYWTDPTLPKGQTATDGRRYVVRWSAVGSSGRAKTFNATDLNCMLDDLKPYTQYEFQVKLIKGGRESAWSMIVSNTSLEAAPSTYPRDLRVSPAPPAARAVDLTWAAPTKPNGVITEAAPSSPPRDLRVSSATRSGRAVDLTWATPTKSNGNITGYVIMYAVKQRNGGPEEWTAVAVVGDRTRARVDRLRARTTYSFKVQARNNKGLGPFSQPVTYTTSMETGEGGGLASATSAWLWASAGGACAVLALAAALALSLCCRRSQTPMSPDTSTYQKSSASAAIKPPDLWIHHDQMELKHMDKSLHSSAISAGSVDGPGLVSSTLTLGRSQPVEYEPARHAPPPASLDRRHYVPTYVDSRRSPSCAGSGSDDTAILRASPASIASYRRCERCEYKTMTGLGGVGCASTCDRRQHPRHGHPDQSTPLLAGVAPLGSPQSSLASLVPLHPPPAPCGSGTCPLGAACSVPPGGFGPPVLGAGGTSSVGSDIYACAARERGQYVAYEPLGHYTHRDSLSSDAGTGGSVSAAGAGSLQRARTHCAAPLHSFALTDPGSNQSTPSHGKGSVRETSPYKKSTSSSPGHVPNRLQLGGSVPHCSEELEPLTPSRSTERLHREMQNLEGLMKDLSAITQQQFHC